MDLRARYEEIIRENLELDILSQDSRFDIARVNEMVEIMLDVVCSTRPTICINGEDSLSIHQAYAWQPSIFVFSNIFLSVSWFG